VEDARPDDLLIDTVPTRLAERGDPSATIDDVLHQAVRALRMDELRAAYGPAWDEWGASGEAEAWEPTAGDGL
jgi:hypothetical protein